MVRFNPKFDSSLSYCKLEVFKHALNHTLGIDLYKVLWNKSQNAEDWLERRTNYSRSMAVMSIVGYILGLGDRDPNNILMNQETGKIVHIDFSNCFEVSMKRDTFPEKVPFRLTRMLIRALGITGVEGIFRLTCEKTLLLMKNNRDSLLAILSALVHNPLISFRLLIPLILKKQKKFNDNDKSLGEKELQLFDEIKSINSNETNKTIKKKNKKKRLNDYSMKMNNNKKIKEDDFEGKEERQIMEREQRQIFNSFEENEDIDTDELYKIAQLVLQRISNKLIGMHYKIGEQLNEKEQVNYLIKEATSIENLASSYLGWRPYW
jgi:FKBP12-rapamycin complex-associated protein